MNDGQRRPRQRDDARMTPVRHHGRCPPPGAAMRASPCRPPMHLNSVVVALCVATALPSAAQGRDRLLTGRVSAIGARPVAGASVAVTDPERQTFFATSDSNGRFAIRIRGSATDFLLHVSAPP